MMKCDESEILDNCQWITNTTLILSRRLHCAYLNFKHIINICISQNKETDNSSKDHNNLA